MVSDNRKQNTMLGQKNERNSHKKKLINENKNKNTMKIVNLEKLGSQSVVIRHFERYKLENLMATANIEKSLKKNAQSPSLEQAKHGFNHDPLLIGMAHSDSPGLNLYSFYRSLSSTIFTSSLCVYISSPSFLFLSHYTASVHSLVVKRKLQIKGVPQVKICHINQTDYPSL